ncbi:hypothetical protein MON38_18345 [Hymenobacter sp. DH14]|uniref:DUF1682 domain-containing protein n=1 Tax=Hymenobacter cyanobacteriorum TaxID=2926463 RepID=A0A9X1VHP9_9BACT|nr:hypothetical protein [Hymenobacter cyanobacteriorum]MCI1189389.1 hypothetical protein [Hymenobacter cyanobacteriorum]
MDRKFWLLRGLRFFFFAALFITVAGFATQALWNWLMPALFRLPTITLGQTFGLLLLSRILFGGFRGGRPGGWARKRREWQQRMAGRLEHLSPEAREKFRQQMRSRCGAGWGRQPEPSATPATQQPA